MQSHKRLHSGLHKLLYLLETLFFTCSDYDTTKIVYFVICVPLFIGLSVFYNIYKMIYVV